MNLLFKRVKVFDGTKFLKGRRDVLLLKDRVERIEEQIATRGLPKSTKIIECHNLWLSPGFIDLHCHLREPGEIEKETIETGLLSAGKGGFTFVVSMPNTKPPCDNIKIYKFQLQAREKAIKNVGRILPELLPSCALTKGRQGAEPVKFAPLVKAGGKIFTDDGRDVLDEFVLREIFLNLSRFKGIRKMFHAEAYGLSKGGIVHLGPVSKKLKVQGNTRLSEDVAVARALVFAEAFKVPIHITHLSSYRSVLFIKRAKRVFEDELGLHDALTCDVTPHHLALTVEDVKKLGSLAKANPPLREEKDRDYLVKGLLDGTIDCIATDHAPHTSKEKALGLKKAPFGIGGFETAFAVAMEACNAWKNLERTERVLSALTSKPAEILYIPERGRLREGSYANITVIDPNCRWIVRGEEFASKCKLTPFEGRELRGKVVATLVNGEVAYADCERFKCRNCEILNGIGCSS